MRLIAGYKSPTFPRSFLLSTFLAIWSKECNTSIPLNAPRQIKQALEAKHYKIAEKAFKEAGLNCRVNEARTIEDDFDEGVRHFEVINTQYHIPVRLTCADFEHLIVIED